jgi:hypothetical protein
MQEKGKREEGGEKERGREDFIETAVYIIHPRGPFSWLDPGMQIAWRVRKRRGKRERG